MRMGLIKGICSDSYLDSIRLDFLRVHVATNGSVHSLSLIIILHPPMYCLMSISFFKFVFVSGCAGFFFPHALSFHLSCQDILRFDYDIDTSTYVSSKCD